MKLLPFLLALLAFAATPAQAGVTVSAHFGGGHFGGYCFGAPRGVYHCYYGGRGYGFYGGYGYAPFYGYSSYPIGYDEGSVYAPADTAVAQPPTPATNPAQVPAGPLPSGKIDEFGFVHSPYSTSTFKATHVANGQVFYDPTTGQPFIVPVTAPTPAPPPTAPSATSTSTGKLDEFGYVHSPFSTFTFKVQNGNYTQVFRDPFTGHTFTVAATAAPAAVATAKLGD